MDFSIIVATYNAEFNQIKATLSSIIEQKATDFEVILCDDASGDNHFGEIREFFAKRGFEEYTLLGGKNNLGTVKNMLRGIRAARGKYSKLIGAGDMLYDSMTLKNIMDFMENNGAECCFGLLRGYRVKDGRRESVRHVSPRDIEAYRNGDKKRIAENILVSEDWVSGAGIFAKTSYYLKYISMLEDRVIYCEDWAQALSLADGVYMSLYDKYAVWYEVGDGVSTTPNPEWRKKLIKDNSEFWTLFEEYLVTTGKDIFKRENKLRRRKKKADRIGGKYLGVLFKAVSNPKLVAFEFRARGQEKKR